VTQSNSAPLWVTLFPLYTFLTAKKGILDNLAKRVVIPPNTVLIRGYLEATQDTLNVSERGILSKSNV